MKLKLNLLGEVYIELGDTRIILPFKKAEAIVFYLALEGPRSKEKIKNLFWGDKDERQASGNMRNVIYLLRKHLPNNFSVDHGSLVLRDYITDVDELCSSFDTSIPLSIFEEPLYGFEFLEIQDFNEWLIYTRRQIKDRIISWLKARSLAFFNRKMDDARIDSLLAILKIDYFDEEAVIEIMKIHTLHGQTAKALSIYKEFYERLQNETGALPGSELQRFAEELSIKTPSIGESHEYFFCGREKEVRRILDSVMYRKGSIQIHFIYGEAGVGKTALINHVMRLMNSNNAIVFRASPIPVGEKFAYSAWDNIVAQMVNLLKQNQITLEQKNLGVLTRYFYDVSKNENDRGAAPLPPERETLIIAKILAGMTAKLSIGKRLFFILEDMHWFDVQSLNLLRIFISELQIPAIFFMTSRPESSEYLIKFIYNLRPSILYSVHSLQLLPFTKEEVMNFCRVFLPEELIRARGENYFVGESAGMPLLLVEMTKILRENANAECRAGLRGLILGRMEELTKRERYILSVLSVFGGPALAEDLALVAQISLDEIFEPIEVLLSRKMVHEIEENGDIFVEFLHDNVRECVYDSIPKLKRKSIHQKIAATLKRHYSPHKWNPVLSGKLRHHYKMAGNDIAVLEQYLQEMSFHINLNHILFPMIQDSVLLKCSLPFSDRKETEEKFTVIDKFLRSSSYLDKDIMLFKKLEASYLEMYGRYKINWGEYEGGRQLTDAALKTANEYGFDRVALYCLEDIAHHYLQTDRSKELSECGEQIYDLARKLGKVNHQGLALRLIGMSKLIERDYNSAEEIFFESIKIFKSLEITCRFYTLNLLAPRCYIGEMRQWQGESEYAMEQYLYCLDRCKSTGLFWGQSHFHAHAADTALDMNNWQLMQIHIREGVSLFESSQGGHCSSILYSLKAICDAQNGDFNEAVLSLKKADFLAAIGKRSWCAAQLMAKAWVSMLSKDKGKNIKASDYLLSSPKEHAAESVKLYEELGAYKRAEIVKKRFII